MFNDTNGDCERLRKSQDGIRINASYLYKIRMEKFQRANCFLKSSAVLDYYSYGAGIVYISTRCSRLHCTRSLHAAESALIVPHNISASGAL